MVALVNPWGALFLALWAAAAYWRRIAIDQPLLITDLNGMPLSLKPGRTFYEVLKEDSTATQDEVQWYFQFEP